MKGGVVETPTSGNINKHLNIETGMPLFVELKTVIARDRRIDSGGHEFGGERIMKRDYEVSGSPDW